MKTSIYRSNRARRGGQTLVETALVLAAILLPLTLGLLQYGVYLNATNTLTQLAREGGRYAALHGTEPTYETATEDYIQQVAIGTTIKPSDIPDTAIKVETYPATPLRVKGNPIRVTITYPMAKKIFMGRMFPFLPNTYVTESTFIIE